jgi:hypothetical protein
MSSYDVTGLTENAPQLEYGYRGKVLCWTRRSSRQRFAS